MELAKKQAADSENEKVWCLLVIEVQKLELTTIHRAVLLTTELD